MTDAQTRTLANLITLCALASPQRTHPAAGDAALTAWLGALNWEWVLFLEENLGGGWRGVPACELSARARRALAHRSGRRGAA